MFNSLSRLPTIPYNIMVYLAKSTDPIAEIFWKMLAYKDYKALSHEPLTFQQKMKLVWLYGKQDTYSVFLTNLIEDAMAESKQIVKIYQYYIHASDKQRFLRQLNREEYPDVKEIIRRYSADEEDFKNINFNNMQILFNETERDRLKCCDTITDYDWFWY